MSITIDNNGEFVGGAPASREDMQKKSDGMMTVAESYVIDSPEMRAYAYADLTAYKRAKKEIEEKRASITAPLTAAHKAVMNLFRSPIERIDAAVSVIEGKLLCYDAAERKKAQAEQERLQAEARKVREKAEAEAKQERDRIAAIELAARQAAELAARQAKEREGAALAEQERLRIVAANAAREGDLEESRAIEELARQKRIQDDEDARIASEKEAEKARALQAELDLAEQVAAAKAHEAAVVTTTTVAAPDTKGSRAPWKGKCTNKMALIKFIANNPAFENLIEVNASALNALAKAQKQAMAVDGCTAYQEHSIAAGRAS